MNTVIVQHRVDWVRGNPVLVKAPAKEQKIVAWYTNGRIKTISGDIWHVKKVNGRLYTTGKI